jgi:hypothetical protein
MKLAIISLMASAVLSWLLYIAEYYGPEKLAVLVALFTTPIRLLTSLIIKNGDTGEMIYWILLTCINTIILYPSIALAATVKRRKRS